MLFVDANNFGAFAGDGPMGGSSSRGGPSNRGNRGGGGGVSDENLITSFMKEIFLLAK
jgi:hypothetical protein